MMDPRIVVLGVGRLLPQVVVRNVMSELRRKQPWEESELSLPRQTAPRAKAGGKELGSWCLPPKAASQGGVWAGIGDRQGEEAGRWGEPCRLWLCGS